MSIINDEPITRVSGLQVIGSGTTSNGFYTPQLTQAQINAIPKDEVQIGGIVYNSDTQELQYFSPALQWVNITSDGGEPTFSTINVLEQGTFYNLSANKITTGTAIVTNATIANEIVTNDAVVGGTIYGRRPSAGMQNSNISSFSSAANVWTKIPGTTTLVAGNQFTMPTNNRLVSTSIAGTGYVFALINAYFCATVANNTTISIAIAVNGIPFEPISTISATSMQGFSIPLNITMGLSTNDFIELFVMSSNGSNFSAGGQMSVSVLAG